MFVIMEDDYPVAIVRTESRKEANQVARERSLKTNALIEKRNSHPIKRDYWQRPAAYVRACKVPVILGKGYAAS